MYAADADALEVNDPACVRGGGARRNSDETRPVANAVVLSRWWTVFWLKKFPLTRASAVEASSSTVVYK